MRLFTPILPRLAVALALVALAVPAKAAVEVQELTSPDGHAYWLVQEPTIPIVAVELEFEGGARVDSLDQAGRANMTTWLMNEGSGDLDASAFERRADEISARIGFSVNADAMTVSARFLTETLDQGVDLLALAVSQPRFDPDAIERARKSILSSIAQDETDPARRAWDVWYNRAFPGHIYSAPMTGRAQIVEAIAREDLIAAHQALMTRANAHVVIVGDITEERAGALVDQVLGGLPQGAPFADRPVDDTPPPGLQIVDLDVPQSVAVFGHRGIPRDDPDFITAFVVNRILGGGGFSSRLMTEVREKRGLAYGVYSYFDLNREAAIYVGQVQTANQRMAESLDVIRAEWARMAANGPTAEELDKAKKYLTGAFALAFDSNAKIADYLMFMKTQDLGTEYLTKRNQLIEAVTLEDAKRVAARVLHPDELSVVVVGKPEGLEAATGQ